VYLENGKIDDLSWNMEEKTSSLFHDQVLTDSCCSFTATIYGFISHLIGHETMNIPEIFSGVHCFVGMTVNL